jgi:cobalt-zinc-cadmium efflux system protein
MANHNMKRNSPKGLVIALAVTSVIMLLEFFGGLLTNSLALLSDSGHMLSDVSSLFLSLLALWIARRPISDSKPFGYHRFEVLAALFNGVTLLAIAISILYEAYHRAIHPQPVQSDIMMVIAFVGLVANLVSAWALMKESDVRNNLNARSAYLHVLGDAISSVGVIIAGFLIMKYSWYLADPIISGLVALVITKGAVNVVKEAVHILMEGKPRSIDTGLVKSGLYDIAGVVDVHDLRLWTITSGIDSLCCHLVIARDASSRTVLRDATNMVKERFGVSYVAIQVEMR